MYKLLELVIKCTFNQFPIFPVLIPMVLSWHLCICRLHTEDISNSHTSEWSYYSATVPDLVFMAVGAVHMVFSCL